MTEVAKYEDQPDTTIEVHQSVTMSQIRQTALELRDAHAIATAICKSAFVPDHLRGKAEETAVAILYGATVGFDPITAVQQIFAIGGKPALYARAMVAIVLAAGHEIWTEEERPGFVTVAGRRAGSEHVTKVTWTSELAKQAGYEKNSKYKTDPRSMLYARASGDVARRIAPDALLGMAYNVEEMQMVDANINRQPVRATTSAKDQVRAAITAPPQTSDSDDKTTSGEALPPDESSVAAPSESEPEKLLTKTQSKKLHAMFTEAGFTDRAKRLEYIGKVVGRPIETSNDLTRVEAGNVMDALTADMETRDAGGAIPETQPDAEDTDDLYQECVNLATTELGWNLWQLEETYATGMQGQLLADANVEQLTNFRNHLWALRDAKTGDQQ